MCWLVRSRDCVHTYVVPNAHFTFSPSLLGHFKAVPDVISSCFLLPYKTAFEDNLVADNLISYFGIIKLDLNQLKFHQDLVFESTRKGKIRRYAVT